MKLCLRVRVLAPIAAAALLARQSLANTYVVDSHGGAGVDFTDLPPAMAAVQPGDVLLVMSGSYSSFTCTQGISILGYGNPTVSGTAALSSIPQGQIAVVTGLTSSDLAVQSCAGRVVLQQVLGLSTVSIADSADVRLLAVSPDAGTSGQIGLNVVTSRVEVVSSAVRGGVSAFNCTQSGAPGLRVQNASRVHFALSSSVGGEGPFLCYDSTGGPAADGGPAASVSDSELIVAGIGSQGFLEGGSGGLNNYYSNCWNAGAGAPAILAANAAVSYSGLRVLGGWTCGSGSVNDPNCYCSRAVAVSGSTIVQASPVDSTLALTGTPTAGQIVSLTLRGEPGSDAVVWLGRHFVLVAQPGVEIELAVDQQRVVHLGAIPPAGSITFHLNIPATYAPGTLYGVQAECRLATGAVLRSNSIPIVVR